MKKIYCFINGMGHMGGEVAALDEDGNHVCSHFSSNESWAKHDIGITSDWKHDIYKKNYPDGYELVWLNKSELNTHEEFNAALKLNAAQAEKDEKVSGL